MGVQAQPLEETASADSLALLEELSVAILRCQLVVEAVHDEVDLNLEDLANSLRAVQDVARQAYGAASLLHQGAELDARWGNNLSRPKAIFARHNAAVRAGAPKITPGQSLISKLELALRQQPTGDHSHNVTGSRPRCAGTVARTRRRCTSTAMYLGNGAFAAHCYSHADIAERTEIRRHQEEIERSMLAAADSRRTRLRMVGKVIAESWLSRRDEPGHWAERLAALIGET